MTTKKLILSLLALLAPIAAGAQVKEPYAVLSNGNSVLTFYYDDQKAARGGMDVGPFAYSWDNGRWIVSPGWYEQSKSITRVVFDDSFADCTTLTSTAYWFFLFQNMSSITGIENLKTDNVTNMSSMFYYCSGLTCLDVSGFKTDNVTNMNQMFYYCSGLTSLDVSGFKTDNMTNMNQMFAYCTSLTSLDLTGFKTDNVTDMDGMFAYCSGLTNLDLSGFKTDNVTDMGAMFMGCSGLTSIDITRFKTGNVTDMTRMFKGCSSLTSLDVKGFKTDNVTDMSYMFSGCSSLTSLDVSGFNTENVTDMGGMFSGCSGQTTIYAGDGWSTVKIENYMGTNMFYGCTSLVGGAGTRYDESHTDYTYARIDGGSDNPGYFTAKVGDTGISTVKAAADKDVWYDLNGRRLLGEPAMKGVFIKNGKKVVIK